MKSCPNCGQPMYRAPRVVIDLIETLDLPNAERIVGRSLLAAWPRLLTVELLCEHLWTYANEPEFPAQTMQSHIAKLRSKLKPHGWTIINRRYQGYLLEAIS